MSYFAIGLGKPANYFDPWFKDECNTTLRPIHYLPRNKVQVEGHYLEPELFKLVTPEHADSGFLTLLSTFMYPGLQVEIDGEYKSIAPVKNAIIINIGETLQSISHGKIKATKHRVVDIHKERYSCAFFLEPKLSARISNTLLESARVLCEDKEYESDPVNKKEMEQVEPFAQYLVNALRRK